MLSKNLKKLRRNRSLTQQKLAKGAGLTLSTLAHIEAGINKNPTLQTLQKLADFLRVSLDDLISAKEGS